MLSFWSETGTCMQDLHITHSEFGIVVFQRSCSLANKLGVLSKETGKA